ncbi:hypothetical protein LCGC14_0302980 [marine sediment metagenome]|uniref:Uncharacterized protein n=1 Tax=marine sediment metagenome TaxID=412755 RepID=A0A0F9U6T2_9ZZZZ
MVAIVGLAVIPLTIGFFIGLFLPVIAGEFNLKAIYKTNVGSLMVMAVVASTAIISWLYWQDAGDFVMSFENLITSYWPAIVIAPVIGVFIGRQTKFWHILN